MTRAAKHVTLVLDDYHVIHDRHIHESLAFLIAHQPASLHLALATRVDPPLPLARLRARQQLCEIRSGDLRFSVAETGALLNDGLDLALPAEDIEALAHRTEGWITGLQLAALSLRTSKDRHRFVVDFSGSHRYIVDYLMAEVLSNLPEDTRRFLRRTAILERLCAPLCAAVLSVDHHPVDRKASEILDALDETSLFLVRLDDERLWYRYHQLFADFQLRRLETTEPELIPILHQRAGDWYNQQGNLTAAISHLLAAEAYGQVVTLIEERALTILTEGQVGLVEGWCNALPAQWRTTSLSTNLTFVWALLMRGQYASAFVYLARAEEAWEGRMTAYSAEKQRELDTRLHAMQSIRARVQGDLAGAQSLGTRAVAEASHDQPYPVGVAHVSLGAVLSAMRQTSQAVEHYSAALEAFRQAGILSSACLAAANLLILLLRQGRLREADQICRAEFNALGASALELSRLSEHRAAIAFTLASHSRLLQTTGELAAAEAALAEARTLITEGAPAWVRAKVFARQAELALSEGDTSTAEAVLSSEDPDARRIKDSSLPRHDTLALAQVALDIYLGTHGEPKRLTTALRETDAIIRSTAESAHTVAQIQALTQRALILSIQRETSAACADLAHALQMGAPESLIRTFVDLGPSLTPLLQQILADGTTDDQKQYVQRLLGALGARPDQLVKAAPPRRASTPVATRPLVEPLSDREMEVVVLLTGDEAGRRILVAYASRAGSTAGVAAAIGSALCDQGAQVDVMPAEEVVDVAGYQALVLGSAVYMGRWMAPAVNLLRDQAASIETMPVALFTVYLTMKDPTAENRARVAAYLDPVLEETSLAPVDTGLFAGRLKSDHLSPLYRLVIRQMDEKDADYRDWGGISTWAKALPEKLGRS